MASLYSGMLRDAGVEITISEFSSREVIAPALQAGNVDVVPEYLGTYTEFLNKQVNGPEPPQWRTPTSPRPWRPGVAWPNPSASPWPSRRWPPTRTPSR